MAQSKELNVINFVSVKGQTEKINPMNNWVIMTLIKSNFWLCQFDHENQVQQLLVNIFMGFHWTVTAIETSELN